MTCPTRTPGKWLRPPRPFLLAIALATALAAFLAGSGAAAGQPKLLVQAHAHNDYEHPHPLQDALDQGFCSVEADIFLVDGKLLVAHQLSQVKPERTLESLYLEPLRARVRSNRGRVYADGPEFTLLVDIKTDRKTTYPELRKVLEGYAEILTRFGPATRQTNAITVILTGDRGRELFAGESSRLAALDGTLADLEATDSADLIPWISSDWEKSFHWHGEGHMPADEQRLLRELVAKAHQHGRRVRFWDAPDQPVFWAAMLDHGVDLINTDDLAGLQKFIARRKPN